MYVLQIKSRYNFDFVERMNSTEFSNHLHSVLKGGPEAGGGVTVPIAQLSTGGNHREIKETSAISRKTEAFPRHSLDLLWFEVNGIFPF